MGDDAEHLKWLGARMREAQSVRAGATVKRLLEVFRPDGGLQRIPPRRFVLRSCPFIKVDVEFEPGAGGARGRADEHGLRPDARVAAVSRPYLEPEAMD